MDFEVIEAGLDALTDYAAVPIAFRVESVLQVEPVEGGLGGLRLREEAVPEPYVKDYDASGDRPQRWPQRFDVSNWCLLLARAGDRTVGGAVVAFDTPDVHMLEGRKDIAALWDIRVHPDFRRRGIGAALIRRAADWARRRGCVRLKIETQNVNVRACRFYAAMGCHLRAIDRHAYSGEPSVAHETMLLWSLDL